ncbi:MAG: type II toxin-antitoxin system VapC family toxin [Verrucomicrobia bacterium]|nr:type II toxin-antitoxin system VapC family toxin [Verrucomicrobiota bacterium]
MILVDANLLVYAHVKNMAQHAKAKAWLDAQINSPARVGLPWPSLLGFLRLVTNPRVFNQPETLEDAWQWVGDWLDNPNVWIPQPTERHREVLASLLPATAGRPNLVPDAHLAAVAIEHGLTVCSADGDFGRFPGLRWVNPLQ